MDDEIRIDRLSTANDRRWSAHSNGMYDFDDYRETQGELMDPDSFLASLPPNTSRVLHKEEWWMILSHMTDEEKSRIDWEY